MTKQATDLQRERLDAILARCHKRRVQVGGVLHVILGVTAEEVDAVLAATVEKGLRAGEAVQHADGSREWINHDTDWVDGDYVWAADGNRVRVRRTHVRISKDGERTEEALRPVYRSYDRV